MEYNYECLKVQLSSEVATVFMYWPDGIKREPRKFHSEFSDVLWRCQFVLLNIRQKNCPMRVLCL